MLGDISMKDLNWNSGQNIDSALTIKEIRQRILAEREKTICEVPTSNKSKKYIFAAIAIAVILGTIFIIDNGVFRIIPEAISRIL